MALNVDTIVGSEILRQYSHIIYEESIFESNLSENRSSLLEEEEKEEEGEGNVLDILKEYLRDVDEKGHESLKKLGSTLGNIFSFIKEGYDHEESKGNRVSDYIEKIRGLQNRGDDFTCSSREVDLGSISTMSKMERFKVKTLNLGGGTLRQEQK